MKIFIDNVIIDGLDKGELYIESDPMQFMINVYNGKFSDKGVALYTNKGYYGSLSQAVKAVVRMNIHNSTATTLHELLRDLARIEADINSKIAV